MNFYFDLWFEGKNTFGFRIFRQHVQIKKITFEKCFAPKKEERLTLEK
jgi:hypothetical protein